MKFSVRARRGGIADAHILRILLKIITTEISSTCVIFTNFFYDQLILYHICSLPILVGKCIQENQIECSWILFYSFCFGNK